MTFLLTSCGGGKCFGEQRWDDSDLVTWNAALSASEDLSDGSAGAHQTGVDIKFKIQIESQRHEILERHRALKNEFCTINVAEVLKTAPAESIYVILKKEGVELSGGRSASSAVPSNLDTITILTPPVELTTSAIEVAWEHESSVDDPAHLAPSRSPIVAYSDYETDVEMLYTPGTYQFVKECVLRKGKRSEAYSRKIEVDEVIRIRRVFFEKHRLGWTIVRGKTEDGWVTLKALKPLAFRINDEYSESAISSSEERAVINRRLTNRLNAPFPATLAREFSTHSAFSERSVATSNSFVDITKELRNHIAFRLMYHFWRFASLFALIIGIICTVLFPIFTREANTLKLDRTVSNDLGSCNGYRLTPFWIVLLGCFGNIILQVIIFGKETVKATLRNFMGSCFDSLAGRMEHTVYFYSGDIDDWGVSIDQDTWEVLSFSSNIQGQFEKSGIQIGWKIREFRLTEVINKMDPDEILKKKPACEIDFLLPSETTYRSQVFFCNAKKKPERKVEGRLRKCDVVMKIILLPVQIALFCYTFVKDVEFVSSVSDTNWGRYQCFGLIMFNSSNFRASIFASVFGTIRLLYEILGDFENENHPLKAKILRYTVNWSLISSYFYFTLLIPPFASHIFPGFIIFFWFPLIVIFCCLSPMLPLLSMLTRDEELELKKGFTATDEDETTVRSIARHDILFCPGFECRHVCPECAECDILCKRIQCGCLVDCFDNLDRACLQGGSFLLILLFAFIVIIVIPIFILLITVIFLSLQYEMTFRFYNGASYGDAFIKIFNYRSGEEYFEQIERDVGLLVRAFV